MSAQIDDGWAGRYIGFRPTTQRWKTHVACYCAAYRWPHTVGMGLCDCYVERSYRTAIEPPHAVTILREQGCDLCEACGLPSDTREVDYGIGAYEFWGACGTDVNWQTVSDCCEAGMVPNALGSGKPEWWSK